MSMLNLFYFDGGSYSYWNFMDWCDDKDQWMAVISIFVYIKYLTVPFF